MTVYLVGRRLPYALKKRDHALREGQKYSLVVREVDDAGHETVIFEPEGAPSYVPLARVEVSTPDEAATPEPAAPAVARQAPTRTRGGKLTLGKTDGWPTSKGAQIVRRFIETSNQQVTAQEIVAAVGDELRSAGIEFPGSLVSRLKQAGFLKEAA